MPDSYNASPRHGETIFWVETDVIKPNPYQPRREFDEQKLKELADSIKAYGILQPLVVARREIETETGAAVEYELIAGERRLRAAKLANIAQVPVIIRQEPPEQIKLELALIENVQREDLGPLERAEAFKQLTDQFRLKQREIGDRIGKSREFIANTIRLLSLPDYIKTALREGKINEGHTRPLLMLSDRPEEQNNLLQEILLKKLNVRESEKFARHIAFDRARKKENAPDNEMREFETQLSNALGTRVSIERRGPGGRISIDFFSPEDLHVLLTKVADAPLKHYDPPVPEPPPPMRTNSEPTNPFISEEETIKEEIPNSESKANDEDIKNFTV